MGKWHVPAPESPGARARPFICHRPHRGRPSVSAPPDIAARVIEVMPEALANKIAAGEVVQRPASVAKELIENALDAGASDVRLIVNEAGRSLVQVVDDGCGMSRPDAETCFRRHATSKIRAVEDLERLETLGFRGEALASIAAVSQVELRTKRVEDAAGTLVRLDGGETVESRPCAAPGGTSVAVRNLFYNVPVRRNFLKTPATEFKHLAETFQFLALSNPEAAFTLVHDDREVYRLPRQGGGFFKALRARISDLFDADRAQALVPLDDEGGTLHVRGFAGAPEHHRRIRGEQFLFVNGRYVSSSYLAHAVRTAYGALLPEDTHPFFALFLHLDPRRVDVNVHPTKAEVKFDDQSGVYGFLRAATRAALGAHDLVPQMPSGDEGSGAALSFGMPGGFDASTAARPSAMRPFAPVEEGGTTRAGREALSSENRRRGQAPGQLSARLYAPTEGEPSPRGARAAPAVPIRRADDEEVGQTEAEAGKGGARPLWQVGRRFIVTEGEAGLLVIDQHAAHKRVLYEKARRALDRRSGAAQQLLFPETIDLLAADAELLRELLPDLHALGFELELFSGNTVAVRGVPADLAGGGEARSLLEALLEQYRSHREELKLTRADSLARSLAGRGAVRAGQRLSADEMQALVRALFACEMPYADPQGRPTTCTISAEELARRFGA